MEKADLLEDAKKSLSTAKSSLSTAINNADNNLVILKEEIRVARAAVNAANKRHAQLEKFTKSLCDDCWDIHPTIGESVHSRATLNLNICLNCGLPIDTKYNSFDPHRTHRIVKMPPDSFSYLETAQEAQSQSEDAIKGKPTKPRDYYVYASFSMTTKIPVSWDPRGSLNAHYNREFDERQYMHTSCARMDRRKYEKSKSEYLACALKVKEQAQKHLDCSQEAIAEWRKYRNQHTQELKKIDVSITKLEDHERDVLQSRLDQLSGSKRNRNSALSASGGSACVVCMERPKDIAFQCGHRCCSTCAASLLLCPSCRAFITQRIKLYD